MRLYCNRISLHCMGLCFTAEAFLCTTAVGTTTSSPLQRRAKQSPGILGFEPIEPYAYTGDPEESCIFNCVLASFTSSTSYFSLYGILKTPVILDVDLHAPSPLRGSRCTWYYTQCMCTLPCTCIHVYCC